MSDESNRLVIPEPEAATPALAEPQSNWGAEASPTAEAEAPQLPYTVGDDGSIKMQTKINGQETEVVLTPEDVADRLRKGETFFRNQGIDVVPVAFRNFCAFGGSFHCATLDIRRNGTLESIF